MIVWSKHTHLWELGYQMSCCILKQLLLRLRLFCLCSVDRNGAELSATWGCVCCTYPLDPVAVVITACTSDCWSCMCPLDHAGAGSSLRMQKRLRSGTEQARCLGAFTPRQYIQTSVWGTQTGMSTDCIHGNEFWCIVFFWLRLQIIWTWRIHLSWWNFVCLTDFCYVTYFWTNFTF